MTPEQSELFESICRQLRDLQVDMHARFDRLQACFDQLDTEAGGLRGDIVAIGQSMREALERKRAR